MKTLLAINEFIHSCQARNLKRGTVSSYRAILERFSQVCPKLPKKPQPVEAFLASIHCSDAHKVNHFAALRVFFRFVAQRYHRANPMAQMLPPPLPDELPPTLEPEEMMRLYCAASKPRDRAILTLLIDSGIRCSELTGLCWNDIKGEIIEVDGKTGKREVPISEETRRLLLSLPRRNQYIFHGHKGKLARSGVYGIVSRCMREAEICKPKVGPHRLRHAFGKGFLAMGGDLRSLQMILGHKRISTTEKYAKLATRDLIRKHHLFTPLRAVHTAAQESLFKEEAIKEAEAIVTDMERRESG